MAERSAVSGAQPLMEAGRPDDSQAGAEMNSYMYGTECPICHEVNPNGRYQSHESRMSFCGNHTREEVDKWLYRPAKREKQPKNWRVSR